MSNLCLICSDICGPEKEYHPACSRRLFGVDTPPRLDLTLDKLKEYAAVTVLNRITVTGVQKKLSLNIEGRGRDNRFTIVGLWGGYILKPPADEYPNLPENENTVMRMAEAAGITTVPHGLIRLASGELSFISRRIDRTMDGNKIYMEDLCQIAERMTEDKYRASVERVGKLIRQYSVYPGFDAVDFFNRVIFSYLAGNADMHLKNYSMIETDGGLKLAPAYDLVSTTIALPEDTEESALTINGKKSNVIRADFDALARNLDLSEKQKTNVYQTTIFCVSKITDCIRNSLMPTEQSGKLESLVQKRIKLFL